MNKILLLAIASWIAFVAVPSAKESNEAKVECEDKHNRLREGTNIFPYDTCLWRYHSVPECVKGYRITLRENNVANPLKFRVSKAGLVRLATGSQLATKLLKQGWVKIGEIVISECEGKGRQHGIPVLEKKLPIGDYSIPSGGFFGVRLVWE